jgi:hypothetical protein
MKKTTDTVRALKAALKRESVPVDAAYVQQAEIAERRNRRTARNDVSALLRQIDDDTR